MAIVVSLTPRERDPLPLAHDEAVALESGKRALEPVRAQVARKRPPLDERGDDAPAREAVGVLEADALARPRLPPPPAPRRAPAGDGARAAARGARAAHRRAEVHHRVVERRRPPRGNELGRP